jgi:hypothetical protein
MHARLNHLQVEKVNNHHPMVNYRHSRADISGANFSSLQGINTGQAQ